MAAREAVEAAMEEVREAVAMEVLEVAVGCHPTMDPPRE